MNDLHVACTLLVCADEVTTRHGYNNMMAFLVCSARMDHVSLDKVQLGVYDVVTDSRPRLVTSKTASKGDHHPVSHHPLLRYLVPQLVPELT
jgi:hypothetical protein